VGFYRLMLNAGLCDFAVASGGHTWRWDVAARSHDRRRTSSAASCLRRTHK